MNYSIEFYRDAYKYLLKLDKPTRTKISNAIKILSENPYHPELDTKRMKGTSNEYRLRVGSDQVIYSIEDEILRIYVIKIGTRGDVYK